MKISISTPETIRPTGNFATAFQWAEIIADIGHQVEVTNEFDPDAEVLVALHAVKSGSVISKYREINPNRKIILGLAGTDIYPAPAETALASMEIADHIIVLQDGARAKVPQQWQHKVATIFQSASAPQFRAPAERTLDPFDICVIGFMRAVKDPMRTALASALLPDESKVRIRHAGGILEPKYEQQVATAMADNARYQWHGVLDAQGVDSLLADSQLMVLSSIDEGGARVISQAVVNHTPVLAAANDCTVSIFGEDYPGLFPAKETEYLTCLIYRAETDYAFLERLRRRTIQLATMFSPELELEAWKRLL